MTDIEINVKENQPIKAGQAGRIVPELKPNAFSNHPKTF